MEDNAYEEFASNTIGHLKNVLSARGLLCTGSKQQLVSRCFFAWESKTPLKYTETQQLSRFQTEYDTRLKEANINDPRSFKDEAWSYGPKVDLGQIFSFVLSRKEQDIEFVGHYQSQRAYSYYQSGFVDTIYFTSLNGTKVVTSRVSPSQSIKNEAHDVWIALNKRHEIVVSWCSYIESLAQTCTMLLQYCTKLNMEQIWDTMILLVHRFLVEGTPQQQKCPALPTF
jgi:predicted NodU family carbamoyl transferase